MRAARLTARLIAISASMVIAACAPGAGEDPRATLAAALEDAARASGEAGVLVHVTGPALEQPFTGSQPASDGAAIDPSAPMRIASNTKTFVAAAALRLAEQGRLDIDAPVALTLPAPYPVMLERAGYDTGAITTRMLLQHISGLPDHAQLPVYFEQIMAEPGRVWTREEQVVLAMNQGERLGAPGERFAYSDTGYVLIGAIIEAASGQDLAQAVRTLTGYDALGLSATWWETLEPAPDAAPARLDQRAFGLVLADIHPSMDLNGGGGLVSSLADLARFQSAAATGEIFGDEAVAALLIAPTPQSLTAQPGGYAMGLFTQNLDGETCYTHSGFWGTLAWHCPQSDVTVTAAVTDPAGFSALPDFVKAAVRAAR